MIMPRAAIVFLVIFAGILWPIAAPAQLVRQWVAHANGGVLSGNNAATAMAVDDSGNVYVTGWATRFTTGIDIATIKYSPDGEKLWAAYYDGGAGGREDKAVAVAVDTAHNVYVAGASDGGSSTGFDFVTIKYDRDGNPAWGTPQRYDGPGHGEDKPAAIAVNDSMNVYVTGWSKGAGTGLDYATIKYNSSGTQQWVNRYNGPGNGTDSALAMVLRGSADLYVAGTSVDTTFDYVTIRYNAATGDSVWLARYKGPGNDIARAMVLRGSTELFVTGSSEGIGTGYDYLTIHYHASNGGVDWISRYDGTASGDDHATALALQGTGRLYVTGRSLNTGSFNDFVTIRYTQGSGNQDWVSAYDGPAHDNDGAVDITGGSNPYVAGPSTGAGVGADFAVVQYNGGSGNQNFDLRYNGPGNSDDVPSAVATFDNAVLVTGTSRNPKSGSDIVTIKYVDQSALKYRTFIQDSLTGKGVSLKPAASVPNFGNVRDTAFARAYPKIKTGFAGAPGGLVLGNARPDSAGSFGWIRINKGSAIAKFVPHTHTPRGLDSIGGKLFFGEKKNPDLKKYNNIIVGKLLALRINIAASDAEVTPPTYGDLTYQIDDSVNGIPLLGKSLRQIASIVDNLLTYWRRYPPVNWALLDTVLTRVDTAFTGPLRIISKRPLVVTGAVPIDSVSYLQPGATPLQNPLAFAPGSLVDIPVGYTLFQNYPNPFNPVTTIEFNLPEPATVTLKIFDLLGREVATLLDEQAFDEGDQETSFDASGFASGVYFYRLFANQGQFQQVRKMVLLK
ncbi:MAG TPA: T9SS type A sorting domain-containing protein [Bacteroidota bacterium]|nr:T9SS type A sorting domain-containing protein [Bacteroidota bacterium]